VWRADPARPGPRHPRVLEELSSAGFDTRHLEFREEHEDLARAALAESDAALIWVDPLSGDRDRSVLDEILREVARVGTRVYTHPDVILKMGTKDVLYDTRQLSWSQDTHRYDDFASFAARFPERIADGSARVLKQHRGNGGIGVWKVHLREVGGTGADPVVTVQHAAPRDGATEAVALAAFLERMRPYFEGSGHLIDQAFASRVREGMVRAYLVKDEVVGFARQYADRGDQGRDPVPAERVFGIPAAKTMLDAEHPDFAILRTKLEREWVPGMIELLGVGYHQLPVLWDVDFLFGPRDPDGADTYLLCEINVSCVSPYPEAAPARLVGALMGDLNDS